MNWRDQRVFYCDFFTCPNSLSVTDAEQVLAKADEEDDYETFIEILAEAGEAWSTRQAGEPGRQREMIPLEAGA